MSEPVLLKKRPNDPGDTPREQWRHRIPDLDVLLRPRTAEEIVVGKRLESGSLPDGQAAALFWIGMNESVAVLRDVTGDRRGRASTELDAKPVGKIPVTRHGKMDVAVFGQQVGRKIHELR